MVPVSLSTPYGAWSEQTDTILNDRRHEAANVLSICSRLCGCSCRTWEVLVVVGSENEPSMVDTDNSATSICQTLF